MAFTPCTTLFGQAAILPGLPAVSERTDCIYRPFSREVFFDRDRLWGLYRLDGRIEPLGAYRRGEGLALIGQSEELIANSAGLDVEEEPHVYFGPLIPHYGHFLVTSLARAWFAADPADRRTRLLCHSDHPISDHFGSSYMGRLAGALGIAADRFTRPLRPTRFTNLTIPGPAFVEQHHAHAAFLEPMHRIGDALLAAGRDEPSARPVYLSKARMGVNSVAHVTNEAEVEALLEERGVRIVHPERLSLVGQVRLFDAGTKMLGFAGSAFHSHVFVRDPPESICLTLDPFVNSNLVMLDRLNAARTAYHHPADNLVQARSEGYAIARTIVSVRTFVRDLLDVAGIASGEARGCGRDFRASREPVAGFDGNCLPDHRGEPYLQTLARLHAELHPRSYLEVGTSDGGALALSRAPSVAISPRFELAAGIVGEKPACLLYRMESRRFFERHDPSRLLGAAIDLAFLDGMHHCEILLRDFIDAERHASPRSVIALHDCLPVDVPMTDRTPNGTPPALPHRRGWWTGDAWRTVLALKRSRPDLRILSLDAAPTGLVLVSGLDPGSTVLADGYDAIVREMMAMDLSDITVAGFLERVATTSTDAYRRPGALVEALLG